VWVNASTRTYFDMTPYTPCLSPTPSLPHFSFHPYLSVCHPFMLEGMLEKLEGTIPGSPLPHYVSNMFLWIIFPGRHRFPFPDTLCGCKRSNPWEYYYLFLIPLLPLQSRFWRFWFRCPSDDLLSRFHWLVLLPIPQFAIDALNLD